MNDLDKALSAYERYRQARTKANQANKALVFDALAAAGITEIFVEFDGEGDQGQVGSPAARRGNDQAELPPTTVTMQQVFHGTDEPTPTEQPLSEAIETLCYGCLEETNDGWENNDGAFGEFRLNVAARSIELEFNARYTDTFTSYHTL